MAETLDTMDGRLAIGEVAHRAGLQASAIRYYERVGLLPAPERVGGRRRYGAEVLQLLAAIEVSKAAGFSLDEIRRLFDGFDGAVPPSERWRELTKAKLEQLDVLEERLEGMRALLQRGLECGCLRLEDCELVVAERARAGT
jgi:MerR family transcriptional regulator, redox-sensitive transcriptional activator SoxR